MKICYSIGWGAVSRPPLKLKSKGFSTAGRFWCFLRIESIPKIFNGNADCIFSVAHLLWPRRETSKLEKSRLLRATRVLTLSSWRMLEDAGRALPPADGSLLVSTNPMLTRALCIHSKMQNMHNIFNFEILLLPVSSSMIPPSTDNFVQYAW